MTVNQQTVEETKAQIRGLVNEIAQLAKSGATPEEFYAGLLTRVITVFENLCTSYLEDIENIADGVK